MANALSICGQQKNTDEKNGDARVGRCFEVQIDVGQWGSRVVLAKLQGCRAVLAPKSSGVKLFTLILSQLGL